MQSPLPAVLAALLFASDRDDRDRAWAAFLAEYSSLLLHVARRLGGDSDAAMDRYAFVLDALRRDDCRRLRAFPCESQGKFTTWLVVVTRRLCHDEHRHRYGRQQGTAGNAHDWAARRSLVDLVGAELDASELAGAVESVPDAALCRAELATALATALARLDTSDRLLLRLRYEDELSMPEIARLLGRASPFPLYRQVDRLLALLRSSLEAVGVADSLP
jgi:RNA polymerase sigma factor (sigma-70 family)